MVGKSAKNVELSIDCVRTVKSLSVHCAYCWKYSDRYLILPFFFRHCLIYGIFKRTSNLAFTDWKCRRNSVNIALEFLFFCISFFFLRKKASGLVAGTDSDVYVDKECELSALDYLTRQFELHNSNMRGKLTETGQIFASKPIVLIQPKQSPFNIGLYSVFRTQIEVVFRKF